jgi:hypothetical protein
VVIILVIVTKISVEHENFRVLLKLPPLAHYVERVAELNLANRFTWCCTQHLGRGLTIPSYITDFLQKLHFVKIMTFEIRFLGFFVFIQTGLILQTASIGSPSFSQKNCK